MNPVIIGIKEGRALAPNGQVTAVLNVTYTVGAFGPFTLVTSQSELQSGAAMQKMKEFAATLSTLPISTI